MRILLPKGTKSHLVEYFMCDSHTVFELLVCLQQIDIRLPHLGQSGAFIQKERMTEKGEGYQLVAGSKSLLLHVLDHL